MDHHLNNDLDWTRTALATSSASCIKLCAASLTLYIRTVNRLGWEKQFGENFSRNSIREEKFSLTKNWKSLLLKVEGLKNWKDETIERTQAKRTDCKHFSTKVFRLNFINENSRRFCDPRDAVTWKASLSGLFEVQDNSPNFPTSITHVASFCLRFPLCTRSTRDFQRKSFPSSWNLSAFQLLQWKFFFSSFRTGENFPRKTFRIFSLTDLTFSQLRRSSDELIVIERKNYTEIGEKREMKTGGNAVENSHFFSLNSPSFFTRKQNRTELSWKQSELRLKAGAEEHFRRKLRKLPGSFLSLSLSDTFLSIFQPLSVTLHRVGPLRHLLWMKVAHALLLSFATQTSKPGSELGRVALSARERVLKCILLILLKLLKMKTSKTQCILVNSINILKIKKTCF